MSKCFTDVRVFMTAAGHSIHGPNPKQTDLYEKLITEEYTEFCESIQQKDEIEQADACFDMIWVIIGFMLSKGWNLENVWEEGAISNLNKIDKETGMVLKREDGKVLKPKGWEPPNFGKVIEYS